ncbi:MAG: hypothetical protein MJ211_06730 [Bacteroidales bacterium]|nr:hypothetical protein [Bacteroidales bacterium]
MDEKNKFKTILQMLVPMIVNSICKEYNYEPLTAISKLYKSRLYYDLENEETKLWHFSPLALADLFYEEMTTGTIIYPEA